VLTGISIFDRPGWHTYIPVRHRLYDLPDLDSDTAIERWFSGVRWSAMLNELSLLLNKAVTFGNLIVNKGVASQSGEQSGMSPLRTAIASALRCLTSGVR
jgi:hypothetical protein